jgi:rfaE bifunctional protein kinase chain/domain
MILNDSIFKAFAGKRVGIVGDVMVDRFIFGDIRRISPEAPVPIVSFEKEEIVLGGAGNVAANVASLGGVAELVSIVGSDSAANLFLSVAKKVKNIICKDIIKLKKYKTIEKTRIIGGGQHIVRIDKEEIKPINTDIENKILQKIKKRIKYWDIIVVSDYGKGVITKRLGREIIKIAKDYNKKVIVDAKPKQVSYLSGAFLFTPNHNESTLMSGLENVNKAGDILRKKLKGNVIITQGIEGMTLFEKDNHVHIKAHTHTVFDVVGAGDTVVAACALALAAEADLLQAAQIANSAAGIVVAKHGTATASLNELKQAVNFS